MTDVDYQGLFNGCYIYYPDAITDIISGIHATNQGGTRVHASRFGIVDQKPMYLSGALGRNIILPYSVSATISNNTNNSIFIWAKQLGLNPYLMCKTKSEPPWSDWYITTDNINLYIGGVRLTFPEHTVTDWCLYGFTHDRSQLVGCVNGVSTSPVSAIGQLTNSNPTDTRYRICIGSWANDGTTGSEYSGFDIGEVWFFNRILSKSEIAMLYNLTKSKYLYPILPGHRGVE